MVVSVIVLRYFTFNRKELHLFSEKNNFSTFYFKPFQRIKVFIYIVVLSKQPKTFCYKTLATKTCNNCISSTVIPVRISEIYFYFDKLLAGLKTPI